MSWQATAWAERQVTGSPARKVLLLVLANYADEDGVCWPSQETLAKGTEQSLDTIQRQLKKLEGLGLIMIAVRPQGRGRWPGRTYKLNMPVAEKTEPQNAAQSQSNCFAPTEPQSAGDRAATSTATEPQALRHEPSIEPSLRTFSEPSAKPRAAERQKDFRAKRQNVETIQNHVAQRLGPDGWQMLDAIGERDRDRLTALQERGKLSDGILENVRLTYRSLTAGQRVAAA